MCHATLPSSLHSRHASGQGWSRHWVYVRTTQHGWRSYDQQRINLEPTARCLQPQGTNTTFNTLKNALQVPIMQLSPFTSSVRLKGPFTNLTNSFQQGGIFLFSQDDYVKLVIVKSGSSLGLQSEQNGVRSVLAEAVYRKSLIYLGQALRPWTFYLTGDPKTETVTAATALTLTQLTHCAAWAVHQPHYTLL